MDKIESKLGFFGDPAVIGVVVGVLLGIITKQDIGTTLSIGMGVSAVLILIPRMLLRINIKLLLQYYGINFLYLP